METNQSKNGVSVPLIALGLDLFPVLIILLSSRLYVLSSFFLFALLAPLAGMITGVTYLSQAKGRTGAGKVIAVIATALPLAFIALVVVIFIGATTGVISLM